MVGLGAGGLTSSPYPAAHRRGLPTQLQSPYCLYWPSYSCTVPSGVSFSSPGRRRPDASG
jgi:hypothetical protein